jgi:hypothetical protein
MFVYIYVSICICMNIYISKDIYVKSVHDDTSEVAYGVDVY